MRKFWPHILGTVITALWIRFGLASALLYGSSIIAGGSCGIGSMSMVDATSLDDAYFAVAIPTISWPLSAVGAVLVAVPAIVFAALIGRRRSGGWIPPLLGAAGVGVGALPFLACRFSLGWMASASLPLLVVLFALGLTFLVYWTASRLAFGLQASGHESKPRTE